jgi:hypothetical protein
VTDDPHSPTTAAPTPAPAGTEAATPPVTPAPTSGSAAPPSTADKLREKVPEPVAQAAQTAVAKVTAARESVGGGASSANQAPADRPEILVGGAFAGGFLAALILKRLGR